MPSRTVADLIVDAISASGVRQVFGVVGDALNPLTDAIRRHDEVTWVGCRHEETASFAAGAQAQLTGGLGVCAGTVGPGALHLINGLYDAAKSHAPVLAIAGQVPVPDLGTNYFQEVDFQRLFSDVSCYNHTITDPEQLPAVLAEAIGAAISAPGVSVLTLPGDMGGSKVPADASVPAVVSAPQPAQPDDEALARAVEMIESAGAVTILAGIGARSAETEVIRLAETIAAPVVVTLKAKEVFDGVGDAVQVGQTGLLGNPAAHDAMEAADLILLVGTDFPYTEWYPVGTDVIQIDIAADHIGRRVPVTHGIVADARTATRQLLERVTPVEERKHLESHRAAFQEWVERQRRFADPGFDDTLEGSLRGTVDNPAARIRPEAVAAIVDEIAADDAVFTADTGMSVVWMARFISLHGKRRALGSFNHGSMANALPQAIGAQLVDRDRQVVALCGDGGFTMLMGDLLTAVAEELPLKIVVFDNGSLGMVRLEQEMAGMPAHGTDLQNPDLASVADAMGATGIRIDDPSRLRTLMTEAFLHDGPVLVDVVTNPNEVALPPELEPGDAMGFAAAKVREFIRSRGDEV